MNRIRAIGLWITALAIIMTLLVSRGSLNLSPSGELAKSELYSILGWEMENFSAKWIHKIRTSGYSNSPTLDQNHSTIIEYLSLTNRLFYLESQLENLESDDNRKNNYNKTAATLIQDIESTRVSIISIRDKVEEFLESKISAEIQNHEIGYSGPMGLHFPPVDFRLTYSPKVLVISARNRIDMTEAILIRDDIKENDIILIENAIKGTYKLSPYIANTGGLATYPSTISHRSSVYNIIDTAAHEWLHHYLFFKPLGQSYWSTNTMRSINETTANIFGKEISDAVYATMQSDGWKDIPNEYQNISSAPKNEPFDFRKEMQITRLEAENLLSDGHIEKAEEYMEDRRQYFISNGYYLRVLNQAYFAFHGTYADSPSSISPIYSQLMTIRHASSSLTEFINKVSSISNHEDFLRVVDKSKAADNKLIR